LTVSGPAVARPVIPAPVFAVIDIPAACVSGPHEASHTRVPPALVPRPSPHCSVFGHSRQSSFGHSCFWLPSPCLCF
jgi:hypothetical protein